MENYENNTYSENGEDIVENAAEELDAPEEVTEAGDAELIEVEIIEDAEPAPEAEEVETDEDISSVAEMLATIRNPFVTADEAKDKTGEDGDGDDENSAVQTKKKTDECGLFTGFTLKKALLTAAIVLAAVVILTVAMAAAIAAAGDKTNRASDIDMTADEQAEARARENAEQREPAVPDEDTAQFKVTLDFFDRSDIELYTTKTTLGELLENSGITLEEGEESSLPLDTMLGSELSVPFNKYSTETYVETEAIPYETTVYETDLIPRGSTNLVQNGVNGESKKTYLNKLKNGEIVETELIGEETVSWPQNYIYELGVGGSFVGGDGRTYSYSWRKTVTATYYYLPNDPHTYLGNTPDHSTIAVDMSVIPLGTWVYVKNNRYDFGLRQAQDIGGAIKGDMIDIWLDGSEAGYSAFHQEGIVYDMEIYYID